MTTSRWVQCDAVIPIPRHRPGVAEEWIGNEVILVHLPSGRIHRLNETAAAVWDGCDGTSTTREMAEWMTRVYELDFEQALDYVEQLVAWLAQSDTLELGTDT